MTSRPRAEDEYEFAQLEFGLDVERVNQMVDVREIPLQVWYGQDEAGCLRTLRIKNACPEAMAEGRFIPPVLSPGYYCGVTYHFDRVTEEANQEGEFRHYTQCAEYVGFKPVEQVSRRTEAEREAPGCRPNDKRIPRL